MTYMKRQYKYSMINYIRSMVCLALICQLLTSCGKNETVLSKSEQTPSTVLQALTLAIQKEEPVVDATMEKSTHTHTHTHTHQINPQLLYPYQKKY